MRHIDDSELSGRLRALRVDPPANGFEARLEERLRNAAPLPAGNLPAAEAPGAHGPPGAPGRVIVGPWLRRGPVRVVAAAALLLAGAAAAVEGGVVAWVRERVSVSSRPEPSPAPAPPPRSDVHEAAPPEPPAVPPPVLIPEPVKEAPEAPKTSTPADPASPLLERRLGVDGRRNASPRPNPTESRLPRAERLAVPRVEIDVPNAGGLERVEERLDRSRPGPLVAPLERRPAELERARDMARQRPKRVAPDGSRVLDRVRERRERRERLDLEPRESRSERARRERQIR